MPDYGVVADNWEALPWSWAAERLQASRSFWIVTVSGDGRPHAMPAWGVWDDGDQQFAFSCGPRSRKASNLAVDPRVVIAPDGAEQVVSIEGTADVVSGERAEVWIDRYLAKYARIEPNLSREFMRQNLLVEVHPERAFGIIETSEDFSRRATRWHFGTVE
jgi:nitroimidazol reductase NimA-like FMN-containing flavoprotein (pyridoxamine 5'-phosphate oxidase superfamily)